MTTDLHCTIVSDAFMARLEQQIRAEEREHIATELEVEAKLYSEQERSFTVTRNKVLSREWAECCAAFARELRSGTWPPRARDGEDT